MRRGVKGGGHLAAEQKVERKRVFPQLQCALLWHGIPSRQQRWMAVLTQSNCSSIQQQRVWWRHFRRPTSASTNMRCNDKTFPVAVASGGCTSSREGMKWKANSHSEIPTQSFNSTSKGELLLLLLFAGLLPLCYIILRQCTALNGCLLVTSLWYCVAGRAGGGKGRTAANKRMESHLSWPGQDAAEEGEFGEQ